MRRPYEKPKIMIERFLDLDVIVCSDGNGELPGGEEDIGFNGLGSHDA